MKRLWQTGFALLVGASIGAHTRGAAATDANPTSPDTLWRTGNDAFKAGQFARAVEHYRRALESQGGRASAQGHYNLGTAYYRLGRQGEAILHLEKALHISPRMADARSNLAIVRRHVELDKAMQELGIQAEGFLRRFVRSFTANEMAIVFLALYYVFFGVLIARRFVAGTVRAALSVGAIAFAVFAVGAGGLFAYRVYRGERAREGVITVSKTALMEPHKGEWKSVRALPLGLRVRIESQNDQWVKVRLGSGLSGYVKHAQVGEI